MFPIKFGKRSLFFYQCLAFFWTFMAFLVLHAARKAFSNAGPHLKFEFGYPTTFFGGMDVVFMLAYAVGMVITGVFGDVYNPIKVLMTAMCLTAINQCIFGALIVNFTEESFYWVYYAQYVLNGLFQSAVWPVLVKIMGNFFDESNSGKIFGVWASAAAIGNILGANISSMMMWIFETDYVMVVSGTFITPAVLCVIVSLLTYATLPCDRAAAGIVDEQSVAEAAEEGDEKTTSADVQPLNFWAAWMIPNVVRYALCYACVKGVNYAMFFWLPLYLNEHASMTPAEANNFDMLYNVGSAVGGVICGFLSDYTISAPGGGRSPVLFAFQLLALLPVCFLHVDDPSAMYLYVMLTAAGFFIGGSANVVSSAVCADIGRQDALKGNRQAMGQVTGIIDGVAACGAAFQQGMVSWIASGGNWDGVFIMLPVALGLSCVMIADLCWRETKAYVQHKRSPKN